MHEDDYYDNDGIIGPDPEDMNDISEPVKYSEHVLQCPNCGKQVYEDNDSCPYCGDIMFRYLKHGTFAVKSKLVAKILVIIIAIALIFICFKLAI